MCGIFGVLTEPGNTLKLRRIQAAVARLRHRGPDDEGYLGVRSATRETRELCGPDSARMIAGCDIRFSSESFNVVLGHRRLAILDLSLAGHQPMLTPDRNFAIVFNGEIYNYIEIREELARSGILFHSKSDTEVALAAYVKWGEACLERFQGMFALAIYDIRNAELFLARDPLGVKPLYYTCGTKGFAFASEIKALLEWDDSLRQLNPDALYSYLMHSVSDSEETTLIAEISELRGGQSLRISIDLPTRIRKRTYWSVDRLAQVNDITLKSASARLRDLLESSVKIHLRSDVPVGVCLSGGLDSTALTMLMAKHMPEGQLPHSFTFLADEAELNEGRYVDVVSRAIRTIPHTCMPTPGDFARDFEDLIETQELPFRSTSIYAQYCVFELIKRVGIKVVLDGQGSDELFAGYNSFIGSRIAELALQGQLARAVRLLFSARYHMSGGSHRGLALQVANRITPPMINALLRKSIGRPLILDCLRRNWFCDRVKPGIIQDPVNRPISLREDLSRSLVGSSLPQLLRYEDRNSMRRSVESRVPFCLPVLAQFAHSLAPDLLISPSGETKKVLREAMTGLVPSEIISRRKMGFETPENAWVAAILPQVAQKVRDMDRNDLGFIRDPVNEITLLQRSGMALPHYAWRLCNIIGWIHKFNISAK